MKQIYITNIKIDSVRHLKDINIPLFGEKRKNLIITGKNVSEKTSVLEALSIYLKSVADDRSFNDYEDSLVFYKNRLEELKQQNNIQEINQCEAQIQFYEDKIQETRKGLKISFNVETADMYRAFQNGNMILAYYSADRVFKTEEVKNVEKVNFNEKYSINEKPSTKFVKYLVDLKVTQALALTGNKKEKADQIDEWFQSLEKLLKSIFGDESIKLIFDEEQFQFYISMQNREKFDFNTLSSGYAAILDIVVDIIMRMEKYTNRKFEYRMPGIVLIDEIETHLHLELQKNILQLLTSFFPNIQFIVTTHSPFVINSINNAVIYDLENHTLIPNGLNDIPYEGIIESYFNVNLLSKDLEEKFNRYKELVKKEQLEDEDFSEIARLQMFLEEIPDYLALDITTEYQALKLEFERRTDLQ